MLGRRNPRDDYHDICSAAIYRAWTQSILYKICFFYRFKGFQLVTVEEHIH